MAGIALEFVLMVAPNADVTGCGLHIQYLVHGVTARAEYILVVFELIWHIMGVLHFALRVGQNL